MTYNPTTLVELGRYWVAKGGVNLGVVGDAAHADRPSYHNGIDRAIRRLGTSDLDRIAAADYTFRLARDRDGASNAASGIDLGKLNGTYRDLRKFSTWLVERCKVRAPGTDDIREIIWSPDGVYVKRWSHVSKQVYTSLRKSGGSITVVTPGNGDASHYSHTHISMYRDSEARSKRGLFSPYFADLPDTGTEAPDMYPIVTRTTPALLTVPKGTWIYTNQDFDNDDDNALTSEARDYLYFGRFRNAANVVGLVISYTTPGGDQRMRFVKEAEAGEPKPYPTSALPATVELAARQAEWDRIKAELRVELPARPA